MRTEDVDWVLTVAKEGNLTRAAQQLHVSPPALSEGIRRIERSLGMTIFSRSNRGMKLTRAGLDLLPRLQAVTAAADQLRAATGQRVDSVYWVRVGTLLGYGVRELQELMVDPPMMNGFEVRFDVVVTDWTDVTCGLRSGGADAAILVGPTALDAELTSVELALETRYAVLSGDHPLADEPSITLAQLDEIGWLPIDSPQTDPVWLHFWLANDERGGSAPFADTPLTHNPQELAVASYNGRGVLTSIKSTAEHLSFGPYALVPVEDLPPVPIRLAYRTGQAPPGLDQLIDKLTRSGPLGYNVHDIQD